MEKRLRWQWRRPQSRSWRVDETYIKVRGKWAYLYRAVDKLVNTIDFHLSATRNTKAAKRFPGKALRGLKEWEQPEVLNTDKAPAYAAAIAELKAEGKCPKDTRHRQVKYLNNVVEADHGKLKLLIRPVRGFKTMKTAYCHDQGLRGDARAAQGWVQAGMFALQGGMGPSVRTRRRLGGVRRSKRIWRGIVRVGRALPSGGPAPGETCASAAPSPPQRIDRLAQRLAGLECGRGGGGDRDRLAGPGVAPLARRAILCCERPESGDGDGFALGETVADGSEDGGDHPVGRALVE